MSPFRQLIRVAARKVGLMLLATLIGWTASIQVVACTPTGVQCPTAAVQTVPTTCCGKLVARPVRPGDKGFVQCRCAEKRAAQHDTADNQSPKQFQLLCSPALVVTVPWLAPQGASPSFVQALYSQADPCPSVPPPSLL